jgi:hypothetical protein
MFCVTSAEYELRPGSPCLPEGNTCGLLIGARAVGCTTTAVGDDQHRDRSVWITAFPNPFNPTTRIAYSLRPTVERVRLTVFDLRGRRIARLVNGMDSGTSVIWTGKDDRGQPLANGTYVVRLDLGSQTTAARLVLAR